MAETINIKEELNREMEIIKKEIEGMTGEEIENFLNDALDIELLKAPNGELRGFVIQLVYGGPNIIWYYIKGESRLIGRWGSERIEEEIKEEKAGEVLDLLEELGF